MRRTARIFLAVLVATSAIVAAREVSTLSCPGLIRETLELELQSVQSEGSEVDDRNTWTTYRGKPIRATVTAERGESAVLHMRTEDEEVVRIELQRADTKNSGGQ